MSLHAYSHPHASCQYRSAPINNNFCPLADKRYWLIVSEFGRQPGYPLYSSVARRNLRGTAPIPAAQHFVTEVVLTTKFKELKSLPVTKIQ